MEAWKINQANNAHGTDYKTKLRHEYTQGSQMNVGKDSSRALSSLFNAYLEYAI